MNVLVDTSVWSLTLRRRQEAPVAKALLFRQILESGQPIFLLGVILQELLQGLRDQVQLNAIKRKLEPFPLISLSRHDYEYAAQVHLLCRKNGVQTTTIDCLIASAAIANDMKLLTADEDFTHMSKFCKLELL